MAQLLGSGGGGVVSSSGRGEKINYDSVIRSQMREWDKFSTQFPKLNASLFPISLSPPPVYSRTFYFRAPFFQIGFNFWILGR
jgi:hypothetical protein